MAEQQVPQGEPTPVHLKILEQLGITRERDIELSWVLINALRESDEIGSIVRILGENQNLTDIEKVWCAYQFGRLVGEGHLV